MAGTNPAFSATAFREAIKFAMHMGLPNSSPDRATFRWAPVQDWGTEDPGSKPYDWSAAPAVNTQHADVQVDVAVEMASEDVNFTSVGAVNNQRAQLTILDEDYAQIVGANQVLLGTNVYAVDYVSPPIGLFDVTVYQMWLRSIDES